MDGDSGGDVDSHGYRGGILIFLCEYGVQVVIMRVQTEKSFFYSLELLQ